MKNRVLFSLIFCAVLAAGCSKTPAPQPQDPKQAMRAALQKYLTERGGINLAAMDFDIQDVKTTGDRAEVQVQFRAKQGGGTMQMAYELERKAGVWTVKPRATTSGASGHPPIGATPSAPGAGTLPPGHPPVSPDKAPPTPPPTPKKSQ